jgi:hypothetical protein
MIFLSKYQDNQLTYRTCNLIKELFRTEKSSERNTYILKPLTKEWGVVKT